MSFFDNRYFNRIKYDIKYHFSYYSRIYFAFFLLAILGIGIGIFTALNSLEIYAFGNYYDSDFYMVVIKQMSVASLFFSRAFKIIIFFAFIFVLSFSFYTIPIQFLLIAYRGYVIAYNCTLLIRFFSFNGLINVLVFILPVNLIVLLSLVGASVISFNRCLAIRRSRAFKGYDCSAGLILKKMACFYLLSLFAYLLEVVLIMIFIFSIGVVL
jgi:hypothetical protein